MTTRAAWFAVQMLCFAPFLALACWLAATQGSPTWGAPLAALGYVASWGVTVLISRVIDRKRLVSAR